MNAHFLPRAALGGLLLALAVAPLAAPADEPVISVVAVNNRGTVPVTPNQVLSHVSPDYEGKPLDPRMVSQDVRSLLDTGIYSAVATETQRLEDGTLRLVFHVESRYRLAAPLEVSGQHKFGRGTVRKYADLKAGDPIDETILEAAAARIRAKYAEKRYESATVRGVLIPIPDSPGSANARIEIDEGVRTRFATVAFDGNTVISDRLLRRHTNQAPWWDPYTCLFKDKHLDPYDLEIVRSDARAQYADLGYLDASVSAPQVSETNGVRYIRYSVNEGTRYRIGSIALSGVRLFPESSLRSALGIRSGDIAAQGAIDQATENLRDYYGARGYGETTVRLSVIPDLKQEDVVNLRFDVREGALLHVRSVVVQGNTGTRDKVIRREIPLDPGDVLNNVAARRGETRLQNLGYFASVRHYDLTTDDPAFRDVVYEVEEKPTGQFLIGAGFSSVDHLIGFAELSQNNFDLFNWGKFTGGGQKARVGVQASHDYTNADLSFTEPWFLDHLVSRLALDVDLFLHNHSYHEYDQRRFGGDIGVSRHIPWVGRLGLSLNAEKVSLDDIIEGDFEYLDEPGRIYRYTDENDDYFLGSLKLAWTYDTRDRPFVPTSGTRASVSTSWYTEALGSDVEMYSVNAQWRHYMPVVAGHVLSLYLRADSIDTLDSDDTVPISSRYFLGGGRNVRGFRNRAIGPKVTPVPDSRDTALYRPVGGQTRLQASIEYSVPLSKWFRLGAFYDIGNVWEEPFDADFSEYASSVGGGLRIDVPGFPIRFDYAVPLEKDDDLSRTQRWVFWVGFE